MHASSCGRGAWPPPRSSSSSASRRSRTWYGCRWRPTATHSCLPPSRRPHPHGRFPHIPPPMGILQDPPVDRPGAHPHPVVLPQVVRDIPLRHAPEVEAQRLHHPWRVVLPQEAVIRCEGPSTPFAPPTLLPSREVPPSGPLHSLPAETKPASRRVSIRHCPSHPVLFLGGTQ